MAYSTESEIGKTLSAGTVLYKNTEQQLFRFARSLKLASRVLYQSSGTRTHLYVIENSEVQSESLLRSELEDTLLVTYLPNAGNIGFGAAMNRLMRLSFEDSENFVLANPDGAFHAECLLRLCRKSSENRDAIIEARQFPEELSKEYDIVTGQTEWASGACLLVPKDIFYQTAGFDERFFLYMEDVDFSWRVRALGYKIIVCPEAIFSHAIIGRNENSNQNTLKHVLQSGILLGQKWNNKAFSDQCSKKISQSNLFESEATSPSKNVLVAPQWEVPLVLNFLPDFEHSFAFSKIRWH